MQRTLLIPMALLLAACASSSGSSRPLSAWSEVDVVVVGAGPAGMAAGHEAWVAGAEVLVLERDSKPGGTARWAGGMILAAGSALQAEQGIEDTPELLLSEWESITGAPPGDWARAYARDAATDVVAWLSGLGLQWDGVHRDYDAGQTPRLHLVKGEGQRVLDALTGASPSLERAWFYALGGDQRRGGGLALAQLLYSQVRPRVFLHTEVTGLIIERGRVRGVRYADPDGEGSVRAAAVVLATGGFMRDRERLLAARPELAQQQLRVMTGPHSTGSGLDLAAAAGGVAVNQDHAGLYLNSMVDPRDPEGPGALVLARKESAVVVDGQGRVAAEARELDSLASAHRLLPDPGGPWLLLDSTALQRLQLVDPLAARGRGRVEVDWGRAARELPGVVQAPTLEGAAQQAGLPAEDLPEGSPPYTLVRLVPVAAKAFGGLSTDLSSRVIDAEGQPVPGLYAAGEVAGMGGGDMGGPWGFGGSLGACVYSGRVAGREAAAEASP